MKMKQRIQDNLLQISETLVLVACFVIPPIINVKEMFGQYLMNNYLTPDNFIKYFFINNGNIVFSLGIFIFFLLIIRKHNHGAMMNRSDIYHDYSYAWYCYCAKILGIKKCNLVLVPIYMQFRLVIQSIFEEFPIDETAYPIQIDEGEIKKVKTKWFLHPTEINLLLEDTYPIESNQIPPVKRPLPTLKISRNNGKNAGRHFSENYIDCIINSVRELDYGVKLNVFATTNPMNTYHIAKRVFTNANRGNVSVLFVYQQSNLPNRSFMDEGNRIF